MLEELFSSFDEFEEEFAVVACDEPPFWTSFTCAGAGSGACEFAAAPLVGVESASFDPALVCDCVEAVDPVDEAEAAVPTFGVNSPMPGSLPAGVFAAGAVAGALDAAADDGELAGSVIAGAACGAVVVELSERGRGSLVF